MPDKVEIVAHNCWISENQNLRTDIGRLIKNAYIRGFKRGAEKVRMLVVGDGLKPVIRTKGDKMQSKSDEELADEISDWCEFFCAGKWSRESVLGWLRSSAEEKYV